MKKIPYFIPSIGKEEYQNLKKIFDQKWLAAGRQLKKFEQNFSKKIKVNKQNCVGLNSGYAALHLAILLSDLNKNDEVLVPNINFSAATNILNTLNISYKLVDCESHLNPNISIKDLKRKISKKTKLVIIVHMGGYPCNIKEILKLKNKYSFKLIEDSCHALFSKYRNKMLGTFGNFSTFSFYSNKNISSAEGGLIYCKQKKHAEIIRSLKNHGLIRDSYSHDKKNQQKKYDITLSGFNYRLDDLRANLLNTQIKKIEKLNTKRHKIFNLYSKYLSENKSVQLVFSNFKSNIYARHLYIISSKKINKIKLNLNKNKINFSNHYKPIHMLKVSNKITQTDFRNSIKYFKNSISLPIYPSLSEKNVKFICQKIIEAVES